MSPCQLRDPQGVGVFSFPSPRATPQICASRHPTSSAETVEKRFSFKYFAWHVLPQTLQIYVEAAGN